MQDMVNPVTRLDAAQARLRDTIREVKLCCQHEASCELVQRAVGILTQRLETYLAREQTVFEPCCPGGDAELCVGRTINRGEQPGVLLRDLKALQRAVQVLPACSLAMHAMRLADELLERLEYERREIFPCCAGRYRLRDDRRHWSPEIGNSRDACWPDHEATHSGAEAMGVS